MMSEIKIANCLVNNRHRLKITQEELAFTMGVSKAAVSKWESGTSFPDITLLPQLALELLDESVRPITQESESLAQVYQMLGNTKSAKRTLQISMYQHMLLLIGDAATYSMLYADDYDRAQEILERALSVGRLYHLDQLHPNAILGVYMSAAVIYCTNGKIEQSLDISPLQSYND